MSIPFEVLEKLSIPVTEHKSGPKEHFEMLKVIGRVLGGGGGVERADPLGSLLCI